jgi:hypothetical protein
MWLPGVRSTVRRTMVVLATLALCFGALAWNGESSLRAHRLRRDAEFHGRVAQAYATNAVGWEDLANDPSREADLPLALYSAGYWSRGQALEIELEPIHSPSRPRWRELAPEARSRALQWAGNGRVLSEYHVRQKRRYDQAASSLWPPAELDSPEPEPSVEAPPAPPSSGAILPLGQPFDIP